MEGMVGGLALRARELSHAFVRMLLPSHQHSSSLARRLLARSFPHLLLVQSTHKCVQDLFCTVTSFTTPHLSVLGAENEPTHAPSLLLLRGAGGATPAAPSSLAECVDCARARRLSAYSSCGIRRSFSTHIRLLSGFSPSACISQLIRAPQWLWNSGRRGAVRARSNGERRLLPLQPLAVLLRVRCSRAPSLLDETASRCSCRRLPAQGGRVSLR